MRRSRGGVSSREASRPRVEVLDLCAPRINAGEMASHAVESSRPLLTLGRVDLVRVQVGFRAAFSDHAHGALAERLLLDRRVIRAQVRWSVGLLTDHAHGALADIELIVAVLENRACNARGVAVALTGRDTADPIERTLPHR